MAQPVVAAVPVAGAARSLVDAATMRQERVGQPSSWAATYRRALIALDGGCICLALVVGYLVRFGLHRVPASYDLTGALIGVGWVVALQYGGAYDIRHLGSGLEEAKRILRACGLTTSVVAIYCYCTKLNLARGFVVAVILAGVVLLLVVRGALRAEVARRRRNGEWVHRLVAVGTSESVRHLIEVTERAKGAGLKVIGACVEDAVPGEFICGDVPVLGGVLETADRASSVGADVVAVTGSGLGPQGVRQLGWQLERTGCGLVVAPALTEVAGTRIHVSPVEGLPLVWLDQPQLARVPKIVKRTVDVVGAATICALALPVFLVTALAIRFTSKGPILFRQSRLGMHGKEFTILKFRSMYVDAEQRRELLLELNEQDGGGVLFKIRRDPRVTPVGRLIRKFSIDELPQLVHVLSGKMSLVGPRPLATIDSGYTGDARRRLLVKPGLTGLWQVSGRSELSWQDALRLDLYYVENWSLGLDLSILARTAFVVFGSRGAY